MKFVDNYVPTKFLVLARGVSRSLSPTFATPLFGCMLFADPIAVMPSNAENGEPQNVLTSKFSSAEWTALHEFRVGIIN